MCGVIKPGTLYFLYKGDDLLGIYDSVEEIAAKFNKSPRTVKRWQTPCWHKHVDSLDPLYWKESYVVERIPPDGI